MRAITSLIVAMFLVLGGAGSSSAQDDFIRGDSNGTGDVTIADVIHILEYLFQAGETPPCLDGADADDSGELGLLDGIYLANALFIPGNPLPPEPYPAAGVDPTPDALGECGPLAFTELSSGWETFAEPQETIIRDQATWEDFWASHIAPEGLPPPPDPDPLPTVDFSTSMVVAIVRWLPYGGDGSDIVSVTIDELVVASGDVEVHYTLVGLEPPTPECQLPAAQAEVFHYVVCGIAPGNPIPFETEILVPGCP